MFTKILIANRGEITCRVAASCARLAIKTVAVYSDADAAARHVRACDEAVHIGGSAPHDSYLRADRTIAAALATGAQAIHPGYGFLSENADFAQACLDAGLVFIGPPPAALRAMGLKAESKRLMGQAGVPLVPGYHGADQSPALLQREADAIGYPVLIKASAGGGGKGMRVVAQAADFAAALAACQREAASSFGNADVLLEKYLQRPRHIEIQVFADTLGHTVHLFERDCSVQRRHQKVLEEAPAPGMTAALRQRMGAAAIAAAQAVGYVGAGTVEFIVTQSDGEAAFYFMEMNTRLQVEHPVTEAITGLDLVEWQLRVASGEALPLQQADLCTTGHAIEARICAESPNQQFLPATGSLQVFHLPPHTAFTPGTVRVDTGFGAGDAVSPFYDSLLAKLVVHADTRAQALARMDQALARLHVVGVATNVQFLRHVLHSPSFAQAQLDTALIEREAAVLFHQERVGLPLAAAACVAHTLQAEAALRTADPFSQRDGWRAYGLATRRFALEFHGIAAEAVLTYRHDGSLHLAVGGVAGPLQWGDGVLLFAGQRSVVDVYRNGPLAHIHTAQGATQIIVVDVFAQAGTVPVPGGALTAPMPGRLVAFAVRVGDAVVPGQPLAVLDAMKMEHTIAAPFAGTVAELLFAPGEQVAEGVALLRLQ